MVTKLLLNVLCFIVLLSDKVFFKTKFFISLLDFSRLKKSNIGFIKFMIVLRVLKTPDARCLWFQIKGMYQHLYRRDTH
jgi:hypothetical protein